MLKPALLDLKSRVEEALEQSSIHALRDLTVEQRGETLTLRGSVTTFYHKHLAQELIRAITEDCRCNLVNAVAVEYQPKIGMARPR